MFYGQADSILASNVNNSSRTKKLSVDLIVQSLPPVHDAIGEYTSYLAAELARTVNVRVLSSVDTELSPVVRASVVPCFSMNGNNRFAGLTKQLLETHADAVVLQYNPFAWGRRGWAPDLIRAIRRFKTVRPDVHLGVMFHEVYAPNTGIRPRLMRLWQIRQFRSLATLADTCFFSTGIWAENEKSRRPQAISVHLPVGANLPTPTVDRQTARSILGIGTDALVFGLFGGGHVSKQLSWIGNAVRNVIDKNTNQETIMLLHVGGEVIHVRKKLGNVPLTQTGRLDAHNATNAIAAMDILLGPLTDGISTRRGSIIAALQAGIAVVSTAGHHTESIWTTPDAKGVLLSPASDLSAWIKNVHILAGDRSHQKRCGIMNRKLFEQKFTWSEIALRMIHQLSK